MCLDIVLCALGTVLSMHNHTKAGMMLKELVVAMQAHRLDNAPVRHATTGHTSAKMHLHLTRACRIHESWTVRSMGDCTDSSHHRQTRQLLPKSPGGPPWAPSCRAAHCLLPTTVPLHCLRGCNGPMRHVACARVRQYAQCAQMPWQRAATPCQVSQVGQIRPLSTRTPCLTRSINNSVLGMKAKHAGPCQHAMIRAHGAYHRRAGHMLRGA